MAALNRGGSPAWAPVWWMSGASAAAWLLVTATTGTRVHPEALLGMIGPLASAIVTWIVVARTQASSPERVMSVMVAGLAVKMVFFGIYVVVMLRPLGMRPVPFVASFTISFIALHVTEALFLRRLFSQGGPTSPPAETADR